MMKEFLLKALSASSPSGNEESVIDIFHQQISTFFDECYADVNGNFIAHKKGVGKKIMLIAHADEVGLMITHIDEKGFLYFKEIGGIDTNLLPGRKVKIEGINGSVFGVIGKKPIHLQEKSEGAKELNPEDLWIDISASDKKEAEKKVELGDVATIISNPIFLSDDVISSRALDDKIGLAVLVGVANAINGINADLYFVASIQEELGGRGSQTVTESIMPDLGIVIDVTHATDYPSTSPIKDGDISIGNGVVIAVGPNMNKRTSRDLKGTAIEKGIPFQVEALAWPTGTDARMVQVAGVGVDTALLSIPCRYMHTPAEVVSIKDAEAAVALIVNYLKKYYI